jgi:hypothetical protein
MILGGASCSWFLWWKQGAQPLPLLVTEVSSAHAKQYDRVCKHALVVRGKGHLVLFIGEGGEGV